MLQDLRSLLGTRPSASGMAFAVWLARSYWPVETFQNRALKAVLVAAASLV
jgi:hypothetical protein